MSNEVFTNEVAKLMNHAPTRKMRMTIIKRDGYKCRACGRTPANDVDIELHVHHIFPWGQGGVTEEENLITLCDTCHDGLEPHFDFDLFSLIGIDPITERLRRDKARYVEGVKNYQRTAHRQWEEVKADSAGP
jgi:predicted restriction endonuclease